MKIQYDYNLSKLNTFGISAKAKFFVELHNEADIKELFATLEFKENKKLFLGGGSNVLFTKDFDGIVVLNKIKGIEIIKEDSESVTIQAMSGEIWHDLVNFAVDRGYWGIENLALIPGTVGAAPMQNIGAYGVELKSTLRDIEAFNLTTGEKKVFERDSCEFGYRDSIFKNVLKDKFFILAITLRLSKKENKNVSYKVLQDYLEKNKIEIKGPKDISDAVSAIRKSKLPDPVVIPNAGSFFKNVFISFEKIKKFLEKYPDMPYFEEGAHIKVPSAWLIEQAGWKGKRIGNVGVHDKQALVLVNYGGATGREIKELSDKIIDSVYSKFGLKLTPEINLI